MPVSKRFVTKEDYNAWFRAYREKNREKFRAYNKEYNRRWRQANGYHHERRSQKRYPEKERARRLLQVAVYNGSIVRSPCEVCADTTSEAHHDDYTKPLDVRWLCRRHHTEVHRPYAPTSWNMVDPIARKRSIRIKGRSSVAQIKVRLKPCTFCGKSRQPFKPHWKCDETRSRIQVSNAQRSFRLHSFPHY